MQDDQSDIEPLVRKWLDQTETILSDADFAVMRLEDTGELHATRIPDDYGSLVYRLMRWCDSPKSSNIDATPFMDFLVALDEIRIDNWHHDCPNALSELNRVFMRAKIVAYRMLNLGSPDLRMATLGRNPEWPLTPAELKRRLGIGSDRLREIAGHADVNRPKQGGKNFLYQPADVAKICKWIILNPANADTRKNADELLAEIRL